MIHETEPDHDTIQKLRQIFDGNSDKRILILGTTCAGKTTLANSLPECVEQDNLVWETLPNELQEKLKNNAWTEEMIKTWGEYVDKATQIVKIEAGRPMFATTIFESDIIIYLNINEKTLRERAKKRHVAYETAANYNNEIKEKLKAVDLPVIAVDI